MNVINTIRTVALAGSFFMGLSSYASAADYAPQKFDSGTEKSTLSLKLGSEELGYIRDAFGQSSRNSQASKWAMLVDGEVVTIDGQLAVVWTRHDGEDYLMVSNLGDLAISEQCRLEYLDGTGKAYVDIAVAPGTTEAIPVHRDNYGLLNFALYDENDDFLAQLAWKFGWMAVVYN